MKAKVNEDCIGCGLCNSICPEVFTMTDEGFARACSDIPEKQDELVKEAADSLEQESVSLGWLGI